MKKVVLLFSVIFVLALISISESRAQCAMCTINAEQGVKNGNTQANGLNTGVLFLLSAPFVMIGGIGFLWYRKFKDPAVNNHL